MLSLEFTVRRAEGFKGTDLVYIANLKGPAGSGEAISGSTFSGVLGEVKSALPRYNPDSSPVFVSYRNSFPMGNVEGLKQMLTDYSAEGNIEIYFNGEKIQEIK